MQAYRLHNLTLAFRLLSRETGHTSASANAAQLQVPANGRPRPAPHEVAFMRRSTLQPSPQAEATQSTGRREGKRRKMCWKWHDNSHNPTRCRADIKINGRGATTTIHNSNKII
eukprot:373584-Amphidinium_carterae.2